MSRDTADYVIDKSLATGGLDSAGNLCFAAKGTREEIVEQILERASDWGHPMTREQAEGRADAAIAAIGKRQFEKVTSIIAIVITILSVLAIAHKAFSIP